MAFDRVRAGEADVEFVAQTGKFNQDVSEARRAYHQATDQMSDDAVRLSIAQEKLNRAIARYGPESNQAKAAGLQYRAALRAVQEESRRADAAIDANVRSLDRLGREAGQADRQVSGLRSGMLGLRGSVIGASAAMLGSVGFVHAARSALDVASNLNEQTSKTEQVFGSASDQVKAFARDALGLANDQALEAASGLGALLRPLGVVEEDAARISTKLTELGVDLSSFYNTDVQSALDAIRSGVSGESEPLRRYGILLSETRVQAQALAETGKKSSKDLTDQEKAYARVALILKDAGLAAGDYSRTIDGVANQEREAAANARDLQAAVGQGLTPAYHKALQAANEWLSSEENVERVTRAVEDALEAASAAAHGVYEAFKLIQSVTGPVIDAMGGLDNAAKTFIILGALAKLRSFAGGFALIPPASGAAKAALATDVAAMGTSLTGLRGMLLGLTRSPWTIPVVLAIANADAIDKWVEERLPGWFPGVKNEATLAELKSSNLWSRLSDEEKRKIELAAAAESAPAGASTPSSTTSNGLPKTTASWDSSGRRPAGTPAGLTFPVASGQWSTVGGEHATSGLGGFPAVDIMTTPGATVVAPEQGVITRISGSSPAAYKAGASVMGYSVYLLGASGTTYFLTHLASVLVKPGAKVNRGQPIGTVAQWPGDTGRTHVHVGVSGSSRTPSSTPTAPTPTTTTTTASIGLGVDPGLMGLGADPATVAAALEAAAEQERADRISTARARIGFLYAKAESSKTPVRSQLEALRAELGLVRDLLKETKKGTEDWYTLATEEERLEQRKRELEGQREKNAKDAADRERKAATREQARRAREAAERLGIRFGGPGAGGPVMKKAKAATPTGMSLSEFQDVRASFFGEFASDVFTRTDQGLRPGSSGIVIHQTFQAEKDLLAASREAREAVAHTWAGA